MTTNQSQPQTSIPPDQPTRIARAREQIAAELPDLIARERQMREAAEEHTFSGELRRAIHRGERDLISLATLVGALAVGSVVTDEEHRVIVARKSDGFRALSSVCTHRGCITRYQPDAEVIACPCHGSRFSLDGEVIGGPAPRPLHWLEMSVSDKGLITVDTAVEVPQGTVFKL